jgi:DNA mismatch repair protein MutL
MSVIHVLPPALVAKIAAGEVIERPAFVVKELIENSLDAGATHVTIEIAKGGLESMLVADNGVGMSASDLFLAWQRHTTSKIPPDSDLTRIETLGFRGEALASIAAVSEFSIQSRLASEPGGHKLEISHGKLIENSSVGMAPGTIVRVEHLFSSLPARQKFLASPQTEWHHIVHVVESQALAHPEVRFTLKHNGKLILDALPQTMAERMAAVLGSDVPAKSFPFTLEEPHVSIQGFLGTPELSFQTHLPTFLIVNQRVIGNKAITQAIKSSYRGLLKVESSPFFLLQIKVQPELVDVNVHPRKEEIKFLNELELAQRISSRIKEIAGHQNLSFRWSTPKGDTSSYAANQVRTDVLASLKKLSKKTPIIQLHNLYLITQTERGVLLIDQHAAHEKILYEKLVAEYSHRSRRQKKIVFKQPKKLTLPLSQIALIEAHLETLNKLGFDLDKKDQTTYFVRAVPELFQDRNMLQLFQEVLAELEQPNSSDHIDQHTNRMLSYLSCRMAIKSGDPLDDATIRQLLHDLSQTKTGYTCPHGRPTHLELTLSELEKAFGRR